MFENVTAQTRDDAQGNWHHPAHDMLRGSIARDMLRCIAVADFESGGMSPRQKELFASMPVTRRLLRLGDVAEYKAVEAADEDPSRSMKFFSTIGKPEDLESFQLRKLHYSSGCLTGRIKSRLCPVHCCRCCVRAWRVRDSSRRHYCANCICPHKCARVGTWIKYCWDPTHRPEERRFGCVRMIFRCVDDRFHRSEVCLCITTVQDLPRVAAVQTSISIRCKLCTLDAM